MAQNFISIPEKLNLGVDFFKHNPELLYATAIKKLCKDFGKKRAGQLMWAVYLTEDLDSKFYRMRLEDRREEIAKNFLGEPRFKWGVLDSVIEEYSYVAMSKKKRWYKRLLDNFEVMLADLEEEEDLRKKSDFYKALKVMYQGIDEAEKQALAENSISEKARGREQPGKLVA